MFVLTKAVLDTMSDISWEPWQFPNIPIYKTKLPDDIIEYLWSAVKQAEKDNVNNSNDYSHRPVSYTHLTLPTTPCV